MLAWRDVAVRYKQTVIGAAWAVIRPFLTMVVFTVIFGKLANLPSEGTAPYAHHGLCRHAAMDLLFQRAVRRLQQPGRQRQPDQQGVFSATDRADGRGGSSLCGFRHQLRDACGADDLVPVRAGLADPAAAGVRRARVLASLGPGLWLTALNVKYRDVRYIIPFMVQLGLYVSPVGYSSSIVPEQWRLLYSLNPVVGVIDGFRWCMLGGQSQLYLPGLLAEHWCHGFFFGWVSASFERWKRVLRI